jgi:hypothetical protein
MVVHHLMALALFPCVSHTLAPPSDCVRLVDPDNEKQPMTFAARIATTPLRDV